MKRAYPDVLVRLNILQGQVYAACRMGTWCFDENKTLFKSTAPHTEEYHMFLMTGGCLERMLEHRDESGHPIMLDGGYGLTWIGEWVHLHDGGRLLIFLGPIYLKNSSVEESIWCLDRRGISQHLRRNYLNVLYDVPVLGSESMIEYAAMLHFICYEEVMPRDSLTVETAVKDAPPLFEKVQDEKTMPQGNDF